MGHYCIFDWIGSNSLKHLFWIILKWRTHFICKHFWVCRCVFKTQLFLKNKIIKEIISKHLFQSILFKAQVPSKGGRESFVLSKNYIYSKVQKTFYFFLKYLLGCISTNSHVISQKSGQQLSHVALLGKLSKDSPFHGAAVFWTFFFNRDMRIYKVWIIEMVLHKIV